MLYAYQLRAHPNARYQESLLSLAQKELRCMLSACGVTAEIMPRTLGGVPFLCFDAPGLSEAQSAFLAGHSTLYMIAALEGDLLRPLDMPPRCLLPEDMPEILKYKGKTNAAFTQLLINLALSAGSCWSTPAPRVLDPLCGRGTTLYCALTRGMHATGVDSDRKSIQEGVTYTQKWLQYHRIKHTSQRGSHTLENGRSAPETAIHVTIGDAQTRDIRFILADARDAGALMRRQRAHALAADLPYGVQHAPQLHGGMSSLEALMRDCLPAWREALLPGCAAAIAFNTYTLRRDRLERLSLDAGFTLPDSALYGDFSHWVEQAVNRDVLVALRPD